MKCESCHRKDLTFKVPKKWFISTYSVGLLESYRKEKVEVLIYKMKKVKWNLNFLIKFLKF